MSNYAAIKPNSIADGPGVRVSVFLSGCHFHCPDCHNAVAWDFAYGKPFTEQTYAEVLSLLSRPYIQGLTILGGEPLAPENLQTTCWLTQACNDVWLYTGYAWEELQERIHSEPILATILSNITVLVDGLYVAAKRDITLAFRGSTNQRIIEVQPSLAEGHIVLSPLMDRKE